MCSLMPKFEIPMDFYYVLRDPLLAGMRMPFTFDPWQTIYEHGFRWVVSLHPGAYDPHPLKIGCEKPLEDLLGNRTPSNPVQEKILLRQAVDFTVEALERNEGVVVHCMGGRGRTGTVLGCALKRMGYAGGDSAKIIGYLDRIHKDRGRSGWPESHWQSNAVQSYAPNSRGAWSFNQ